ncbi:hypothetical protein QQX98_010386 [Neonectria punicea]|uniref:Uncharacterized protein n=1 Tax=Neonectria punicea TaxID=979145 RepID=A0ABR1GPK1_9HYPO
MATLAHVRRHPEQKNEVGAIVGGAIAAGFMLGLTFFICFRIYKEYLSFQELRAKQANNPTTNQPGSICSDASFGNVVTPAQDCPTTPFPCPAIPPKAAEVVGIRQKQSIYDAQVAPFSSPQFPSTPTPTTWQFPPLHSPSSRPSSASSMSTLGLALFQDTMYAPSPCKYPPKPLPERPLPALPALESVAENTVERGRSRRYFVPPPRTTCERLQSPVSPAETLGMESVHLERWKGTRFSMGSNKF